MLYYLAITNYINMVILNKLVKLNIITVIMAYSALNGPLKSYGIDAVTILNNKLVKYLVRTCQRV